MRLDAYVAYVLIRLVFRTQLKCCLAHANKRIVPSWKAGARHPEDRTQSFPILNFECVPNRRFVLHVPCVCSFVFCREVQQTKPAGFKTEDHPFGDIVLGNLESMPVNSTLLSA